VELARVEPPAQAPCATTLERAVHWRALRELGARLGRADAEARKKAEENTTTLPALGGGNRAIDLILWETAQARYLEQSATLAGLIEQALRSKIEMSPRPIQQEPFRVLVGANMPAALVEIGYLSNADQEGQLTTASYQDQVANALLDALIKFREFLEH